MIHVQWHQHCLIPSLLPTMANVMTMEGTVVVFGVLPVLSVSSKSTDHTRLAVYRLTGAGDAEFVGGHTFKGDFKDGMMHGSGRYVWKDGTVYEGEFAFNQVRACNKPRAT